VGVRFGLQEEPGQDEDREASHGGQDEDSGQVEGV
jgi:hypothetical protein